MSFTDYKFSGKSNCIPNLFPYRLSRYSNCVCIVTIIRTFPSEKITIEDISAGIARFHHSPSPPPVLASTNPFINPPQPQATVQTAPDEPDVAATTDVVVPSLLKRAMSCDSVCSDTSVVLGDLEEPNTTGYLCVGLEYDRWVIAKSPLIHINYYHSKESRIRVVHLKYAHGR